MSRRKKAALDVPTSDAEAIALIGIYVGEERRLRAVAEFADSEIAVIAQRRDRDIAAAAPVQSERFAAINDRPEIRALFAGAQIDEVAVNYRISGGVTPARELIITGGKGGR